MKRYIKSTNAMGYVGSDFDVGDRINITLFKNRRTDIIGEIVDVKGNILSVRDIYDENGTIYDVDLSDSGLEFEVFYKINQANANRSANKSTSQDHYEVVEVSKWYDPEGLNIPEDDGKVRVSGTLEYCTDWLEDTYYDANQNNYIAVRNYEPGKSLQLYYFNSQSNVNYVIRKVG